VVERANVRATVPSVTAVDLACTADGGEAIDRALRSRTATLDQMWGVLARHRYRRGNRQRAALLHDSADQPWSEAERLLHRLLRAAGLAKWSTNAWVTTGENRYCVDILFDAAGLVLEVDGWETHGSRSDLRGRSPSPKPPGAGGLPRAQSDLAPARRGSRLGTRVRPHGADALKYPHSMNGRRSV